MLWRLCCFAVWISSGICVFFVFLVLVSLVLLVLSVSLVLVLLWDSVCACCCCGFFGLNFLLAFEFLAVARSEAAGEC